MMPLSSGKLEAWREYLHSTFSARLSFANLLFINSPFFPRCSDHETCFFRSTIHNETNFEAREQMQFASAIAELLWLMNFKLKWFGWTDLTTWCSWNESWQRQSHYAINWFSVVPTQKKTSRQTSIYAPPIMYRSSFRRDAESVEAFWHWYTQLMYRLLLVVATSLYKLS